MTFFLPSSASTSTTTSLSSSPLPVLRSLESEDESENDHNEPTSPQWHQSGDVPRARNGLTMFGLFSLPANYLSGASDSEISSFEDDSESEVESSWTRRATFGDDNDDRDTSLPRSTREDAGSPSRRRHQNPQIHEVVELPGPNAGTSQSLHAVQQTESWNVASPTNQTEGEESTNRRGRRRSHRRHDSAESARREVKLGNRRGHVFDALISRDFFLIVTLCFGVVCAWIVIARPIMMNLIGSRSGDTHIWMDG